ncbi:MAG: Cof-type HAD-IIB family hydrolase [Streptococcaceae bacterium]|jgi:Cof subfamily protein (haloacid dehalogenase superfamily)|nr:Cof-type HAD-IIB family hydrolase [Streptococcaceae bacterium]
MTNLPYKALAFFDLDGTLLDEKSHVTPEITNALTQIRKNGVLPIIATGRGGFELDAIQKATGITSVICLNGQQISLEGEIIYREPISIEKTTALSQAAQEADEALAFYDDKHYWVSEINDTVRGAYGYTHAPLPQVAPEDYLTHEVNMLLVLTENENQVAYYQALIPELDYFRNTNYSIDITNKGTDKGSGLRKLVELLDFKGETYAFGDGPNDISLLKAADHATAMDNACDATKEVADYITTANTNHGIVNAFKHWGLL